MNEILMIILKAVVSIATVLITGYLVPLMKKKLDSFKDDKLKTIIFDAVWAAQQTISDNSQKKQYVVKVVREYLEKVGLTLTDEEIDILIESAVLSMKVETR